MPVRRSAPPRRRAPLQRGQPPRKKSPVRKRRSRPRRGPERSLDYLAWIRTLGCVICSRVCGGSTVIEAAHTNALGPRGMSQKTSDFSAIPLCTAHHRQDRDSYHRMGEEGFAREHRLNLPELVLDLNDRFRRQVARDSIQQTRHANYMGWTSRIDLTSTSQRSGKTVDRPGGGRLWETEESGLLMAPVLQQVLWEFRQGLERIYGSRLAGLLLFGSQARGDALPDSDVDVLVVLHGPVNPLQEAGRISQFRGDLCLRHNIVITCVYVSADEVQTADSPLLQNIRAEGVAL